jgi:hypothetical protein
VPSYLLIFAGLLAPMERPLRSAMMMMVVVMMVMMHDTCICGWHGKRDSSKCGQYESDLLQGNPPGVRRFV